MAAASDKAAREKKKRRADRMARKREQTRREILEAATDVIATGGIYAFTLDEVAKVLGVTKPAIYYYFDSRDQILHELVANQMRGEASALCEAIEAAPTGAEALGALVRTFIEFYVENMRLFRLAYHYSQISSATVFNAEDAKRIVHPHTTRVYDATEAKLIADRDRGELADGVHPRRIAVAAHAAALGLMSMLSITEVIGDPLKHSNQDMIDELAESFVRSARKPGAYPAR